MHRTIKHIYLHGKFVKRLDKAIGAIMKFVRDKLYERLIVLHKGKVCTKLSTLRQRHKNSEGLDLGTVVQNEDTWLVSSASRTETYEVEEIRSICSCKLICDDCKACIHRYSCTCLDSSIQWNMCKHIHLVCRFLEQLPSSNNEVAQDVLSENNLVIDINQKNEEIFAIVKTLRTTRPLLDNVEEQVVERRKKLLQLVQEELLNAISLEEIEAAERILAPLKPTLAAVRSQQQSVTNLLMSSSSNMPHNQNIQPQRRLFATKQCRKKKPSLKKPSAEEADVLAIQLLYRE